VKIFLVAHRRDDTALGWQSIYAADQVALNFMILYKKLPIEYSVENSQSAEDESSEDQRCSDCHELARSGNKPALMKAFHANCKGCHKAQKKGPLMCGQCHVKRNGE